MLQHQLSPINAAIGNLQADFKRLHLSVDDRLNAIEARVDTTLVRVEKLEAVLSGGGGVGVSQEVQDKLDAMQKQIAELQQVPGGSMSGPQITSTAVFGGLVGFGSKLEADEWLEDKLRSLLCPQAVETYIKGNDFNGLLFVKFADKRSRDIAVAKFRGAYLQRSGKAVWAKADLPIQQRVPESYLFGLKRVLVEWGFNRGVVRVDTTAGSLTVAGEQVVASMVVGGRLQNSWCGAWADWAELHQATEVVELGRRAAEALGRAAAGGGGGKGLTKGHVQ